MGTGCPCKQTILARFACTSVHQRPSVSLRNSHCIESTQHTMMCIYSMRRHVEHTFYTTFSRVRPILIGFGSSVILLEMHWVVAAQKSFLGFSALLYMQHHETRWPTKPCKSHRMPMTRLATHRPSIVTLLFVALWISFVQRPGGRTSLGFISTTHTFQHATKSANQLHWLKRHIYANGVVHAYAEWNRWLVESVRK